MASSGSESLDTALLRAFRKQVGDTACGLASLACALDAILEEEEEKPGKHDEAAVVRLQQAPLHGSAKCITMSEVEKGGLTLHGLSRLARLAGIPHTLHMASDFADAGALWRALRRVLDVGRTVVLNYHMTTAGQPPFGGHFSPVDSYDASTMRVRVLDVWKQTPETCVWIPIDRLFAAVQHKDAASGLCRGFLVIPGGPVRAAHQHRLAEARARAGAAAAESMVRSAPPPPLPPLQLGFASSALLEDEAFLERLLAFINLRYQEKSVFKPGNAHIRIRLPELRSKVAQGLVSVLVVCNEARDIVGTVALEDAEFPLCHADAADVDAHAAQAAAQAGRDSDSESRGDPVAKWGMLCVGADYEGMGVSSLLVDHVELQCVKRGALSIEIGE